jgi:hypothetical protein
MYSVVYGIPFRKYDAIADLGVEVARDKYHLLEIIDRIEKEHGHTLYVVIDLTTGKRAEFSTK